MKDYDGKAKFVSTADIEATGWVFGVTEDQSVVTAQIMKNIIVVVLLGIIIILAVALLTAFSVKRSLLAMENMKKFIK